MTETCLLAIVRRADVTRLPFCSGQIVSQLWAISYTGLKQLRNAEPEICYARRVAHYEATTEGGPFDLVLETSD